MILVVSRVEVQEKEEITSVAVVCQSSVARPGNSLGVVVCQVGKEGRVGGDVQKSTPTSWTQTWLSLDSDARSHFSASSKTWGEKDTRDGMCFYSLIMLSKRENTF